MNFRRLRARHQPTSCGSSIETDDMCKAYFTTSAASRCAGAICAAMTMFAMAPAAAQSPGPQVLGSWRLCEASAALVVDCPGSTSRCLLVGDNEEEESLFWFRLDDQGVDPARQKTLELKGPKLGDIEALAGLANGKIVAFGSHSRNSACVRVPEKLRFGVIDRLTDQPVAVTLTQSEAIHCDALFGKHRPGQSLIPSACTAIETAEKAAEKVKGAKEKCNQVQAYNAEGAVNVSRTEVADIWIGLRAPLLPHPRKKKAPGLALLMHLKGLDAYAFDKVAALDMGGRGVRELAYTNDGWVWVIAGPPQDLKEPFQLWRFAVERLGANEIIKPERVHGDLPTSSEGLAVFKDKLLILIDGSKATKERPGKCEKPAGVMVLRRSVSTPK